MRIVILNAVVGEARCEFVANGGERRYISLGCSMGRSPERDVMIAAPAEFDVDRLFYLGRADAQPRRPEPSQEAGQKER